MKRLLTIMAIFAFSLSSFAFARGDNDSMGRKGHGVLNKVESISQQLGLTEEQKKALSDLQSRYKKQIREKRRAIRQKRHELRQVFLSENIDEQKAESIVDSIALLEKELLRIRIRQAKELKQILGDEKYKALQDIKRSRIREKAQRRNGRGLGY